MIFWWPASKRPYDTWDRFSRWYYCLLRKPKRYILTSCVFYISLLLCVCSRLCTIVFLFQRLSYDHGQPRQKEIRKGNDCINSKIYIIWGQLLSFCPQAHQASVAPHKPLPGDPWAHHQMQSGRCPQHPARGPGSDALWTCGEGTKAHGKWWGKTRLVTWITFPMLKSQLEAK